MEWNKTPVLESWRHAVRGFPQEPSQPQGQPEVVTFSSGYAQLKLWGFMQNQSTVEVINDVSISQTVAGI